MKLSVINLDAAAVGEVELDEEVFGLPARKDIIARVVRWQLAKRQAGTHQTKGISAISGTTKKPFKQKGTGRARQGSLRSPQFRGGAVIFGPQTRSHAFDLPKKVRKLGLMTMLSIKQAEGKLVVVDSLNIGAPKTKELVGKLEKLNWGKALVIAGNEVDNNFALAAANIPYFDVLPQQGANVYDIIRRDTLVMTVDAVKALEARLK